MRVLLLMLISLTASANAQTYEEDAAAIAAQNMIYMQGYKERNAEKVVSVHSDKVVVYAPNRPIYQGKSGVLQMVKEDLEITDVYELELVTESLEIHGDTAIDVGTYVANLTFKGGMSIVDEGHYVVIWKRQADGTWLYEKDIYNSRMPLP